MLKLIAPFLPFGIVVVVILGALAWLDHRGYARGQADAEKERLVTAYMLTRTVRDSEQRLGDTINAGAARYEAGRTVIERTRNIINPIVTREIISDPRLSDPAAGLSDVLFEQVNAARRAVGPCTATPSRGISCPLLRANGATGQVDRGDQPEGH